MARLTMARWTGTTTRRATAALVTYLAICAVLIALDLAAGGALHAAVNSAITFAAGLTTGMYLFRD